MLTSRAPLKSLLAQTPTSMVSLSSHPITSHLVQASLTSPHASIINKRKIFNLLAGHFAQLAISPSGSHLVDACWNAAQGMNNYWQGIAQELAAGETDVRASPFGRIVWRNWAMDKFKTRRGDWVKLGKCDKSAWECNPRFTSTAPESPLALANGSVKKSAIQVRLHPLTMTRVLLMQFLHLPHLILLAFYLCGATSLRFNNACFSCSRTSVLTDLILISRSRSPAHSISTITIPPLVICTSRQCMHIGITYM